MSLSIALSHTHHDIRTILTIPYEHSKFPRVQLPILNELDGTYFFLSRLNGSLNKIPPKWQVVFSCRIRIST